LVSVSPRQQNIRLLVISDDDDQRQTLQKAVANTPEVQVVASVGTERAEEAIQTFNPDAIVVNMRNRDSIAALRERVSKAGLGQEEPKVPGQREPSMDVFTPREAEVLALTAAGFSMKQIAHKLHRAHGTVARHRANIMRKLGLHDRVALTRFAIKHGLVDV
jgi:DNA-binding NarL/FixJ family response regulator